MDLCYLGTDFLVLLVDLVSLGHLGAQTKLKLVTGKGAKHRVIDICERMKDVGRHTIQRTTSLAQLGRNVCRVVQEDLDDSLSLPR